MAQGLLEVRPQIVCMERAEVRQQEYRAKLWMASPIGGLGLEPPFQSLRLRRRRRIHPRD